MLAYKPIAIFNLAAETHVDNSINGPEKFLQTNMMKPSKQKI